MTAQNRGGTVLVVEDDSLARDCMRFLLEREGYAVSEAVVARDPRAVTAFARASHAAKAVLASDEAAWLAIRPLMQADDDAAFAVLRRRFLEGIPRRPVADEAADAARLYAVLAKLGGDKLVGPAKALPEGLYWAGA